ncbi:MAG TPA: substrate-binding domain-containing protein [Alphaproteobacteria bacterium]|nr:substrate-binding domain-containing protein [Alphaproteobacteria bacterium]
MRPRILLSLLAILAAGQAEAREQIRVVGSSTVFPFVTVAAERFGRATDHKVPVVESTGTGGGIRMFCAGVGPLHPDIVGASRRIKAGELKDCRRNGVDRVVEIELGRDGLSFVNAKAGPRLDLTRAELWLALAKAVPKDGALVPNPYRRWSEIDARLPDLPIAVYGPPPTSGTRDAWVELVMEHGCAGFAEVKALPDAARKSACSAMREDGAFVEAGENDNLIIQKLRTNSEAYGIFGYSFLEENADTVQGSAIEGVDPTFENLLAGRYPLVRSLYLYVKSAHVDLVPGMREFLAEVIGPAAAGEEGYLADRGLVPLPPALRTRQGEVAAAMTPLAMP